MIPLVNEAYELLKNADFDWTICGGLAIDLFNGKKTRMHEDVDISVFFENREAVIKYMIDLEWTVYEACGGGIVHLINNLSQQVYIKNNIFCIRDGNKRFHVTAIENNMFKCEIDHLEQTELDYVEFLFDKREGHYFYYRRNENVKRDIKKAILHNKNIPYLAPEIVLLYKSMNYTDDDHEHDFTIAIKKMNTKSKNWLMNSLDVCYPDGHAWIRRLK